MEEFITEYAPTLTVGMMYLSSSLICYCACRKADYNRIGSLVRSLAWPLMVFPILERLRLCIATEYTAEMLRPSDIVLVFDALNYYRTHSNEEHGETDLLRRLESSWAEAKELT